MFKIFKELWEMRKIPSCNLFYFQLFIWQYHALLNWLSFMSNNNSGCLFILFSKKMLECDNWPVGKDYKKTTSKDKSWLRSSRTVNTTKNVFTHPIYFIFPFRGQLCLWLSVRVMAPTGSLVKAPHSVCVMDVPETYKFVGRVRHKITIVRVGLNSIWFVLWLLQRGNENYFRYLYVA